MKKSELYAFVPDRRLSADGDTLRAVEYHFLSGLPVVEAAKRAGVHRVTADKAIQKVAKQAKADGFQRTVVKKIVWHK